MEKTKTSSDDFDALRAKWPAFGFAVYAYTPGEPVTVEAIRHVTTAMPSPFSGQILDDETIQTRGASLPEAIRSIDERLTERHSAAEARDHARDALAYTLSVPRPLPMPKYLYQEPEQGSGELRLNESKPDPDIFG